MLAKHHPHLEAQMWLPYADYLSANDKFEEAQQAYKKAKRPDLSLRIIEFLAFNAVSEKRFQEAAQFYWMMAAESLRLVKETVPEKQSKDDKKYHDNFEEYTRLAQIYQAYHQVYRFIEVSYEAVIQGPLYNQAVFNASRFLVCSLAHRQPMGISKVYIFYALSFLGTRFEAFKTARFAYEKLQGLKIPPAWQDDVDLASLKVKAKPYSDKEGYNIVCNRCMHVNSLINLKGDFCSNCSHAFIRNYVGFDTLPLVEFIPRAGIPFKKVMDLLKMDPPEMGGGSTSAMPKPSRSGNDGWQQNNPDEQTMNFQQQDDYDQNELFDQKMLEWLETQVAEDSYKPVEVDE
jgi:intraflagellar transport protein 122